MVEKSRKPMKEEKDELTFDLQRDLGIKPKSALKSKGEKQTSMVNFRHKTRFFGV